MSRPDECCDCATPLLNPGPCPHCGSTKRIKYGESNVQVSTSATVNARLIIGWQEVDRLFSRKEYAAALLVAAVNVEFILWENLRRFSKTANPGIQDSRVRSLWGQVTSNHPHKLTLSSLREIAEYMSQQHGFVLLGSWRPVVRDIEGVRNCLAHERGYFAKLTQLKNPNWSETRIRDVLDDAKVGQFQPGVDRQCGVGRIPGTQYQIYVPVCRSSSVHEPLALFVLAAVTRLVSLRTVRSTFRPHIAQYMLQYHLSRCRMSIVFTDQQIATLIQEPKSLSKDYKSKLALRGKRGHREAELAVQGNHGNDFRIILRQSIHNPFDFSAILAVEVPGTNRIFRLRRYNGRTHPHTNRLEQQTILYEFHIHRATARYQELGVDEEEFAEATDRFSTLDGALHCMFEDCGFILPEGAQMRLFKEMT